MNEKATQTTEEPNAWKKFSRREQDIIGAIAVILLAVIIGFSIYNTPANRLSRQLDLGQKYLEELNYEQAIVEFDKAIAIDPMSVEAYLGKAEAYEGMGDMDMAIQTLEAGYGGTGDEKILRAWLLMQLNLAQRYLEEKNYQKSAEGFGKALEIDSMCVEAYLGQAKAYKRMGDIDLAKQVLEDGYERTKDERLQEALETLDVIEWEDAAIENCVREFLGKPEGDIRINEALQVTEIFCNDIVRSLDDLRYFRNLEILWLDNIYLADLSAISTLTNLEVLHLDAGEYGTTVEIPDVMNLDAISGLTNMRDLNLEFPHITDISAVGNLTNLTDLSLWDVCEDWSGNTFTDINAVGKLSNLRNLSLNGKFDDISAVSNLTNLDFLYLSGDFSDINPIGNLINLDRLFLEGNIGNINAVRNLINIRGLEIWSDGSTDADISILGELTNLEWLSCRYNNSISGIGGLSNLENLRQLNLSDNNLHDISEISALSKLVNLEELILDHNSISDLDPLSDLTNLKRLSLYQNEVVSDVSTLRNLINLEDLDLYDNNISDVSALSELTNLIRLNLSNNPITDYSPVSFVENLLY